MLNKKQTKISKEIFKMVYQWGRIGVVAKPSDFAYRNDIEKLLGNKSNGFEKCGDTRRECYIKGCKRKHLPF